MAGYCRNCKTECLDSDSVVVCEGFCVGIQRFHARCVGLTDDEGGVCLYRNIMWMCDDCCALMENMRFRDTVNAVRSISCPVREEIEKLKTEVKAINDTLDCIKGKTPIVPDEGCSAITSGSPMNVPHPLSPGHSSPLTSTRIGSSPSICTNATSLKLHLSNIANDVTEAEVVQMIANAIGVRDIISIKCLKPAWRDATTMDFISFKVEISDCHRLNALCSSRWPKEVKCREFKDFPNTTWRPTR